GTSPTVYRQITANEAGCLVATNTNAGSLSLPQEVFMVVNNFPDFPPPPDSGSPGVQFSFRGHVPGLTFDPREDQAIIVLYPAANAAAAPYPNQERKCIVIASLLGIIKQGTYTGDPLGTLDANNCEIRLDGTEP
ncbi:MAG: prepilin-type family protein, partial [Microcystis aeruginosa]